MPQARSIKPDREALLRPTGVAPKPRAKLTKKPLVAKPTAFMFNKLSSV
jgi:hypothetical protein